MARYVALLRAVNVGKTTAVPMAEWRTLLGELGCTDVRTLLQSGNAVFETTAKTTVLAPRMASEIAERFGARTTVFLRSAREWSALLARNPFPEEAMSDPGHLLVMVLDAAPEARAVAALQAAIKGRETVRAAGDALFITYPDGIGRSKLTIVMIEKALGAKGTARNWNTAQKIATLLAGSA